MPVYQVHHPDILKACLHRTHMLRYAAVALLNAYRGLKYIRYTVHSGASDSGELKAKAPDSDK